MAKGPWNRKKGILAVIFIIGVFACAGCSAQKTKDVTAEESGKDRKTNSVTSICVQDSGNIVSATKKKRKEIHGEEDDEFVRINNNIINGNFIVPYQEGYLYGIETGGDGSVTTFFYDDGQGNLSRQQGLPDVLYVLGDSIYYREEGGLKRKTGGTIENIITYEYSDWNSLFLAENGIYYTEVNEEQNKTYVYRVDYAGDQKELLYELDVYAEQIYFYRNELWFIFHDFDDTDTSFLGRLNVEDHSVTIYKNIHPKGTSDAGNQISLNNGYVYFNSSGFKRLNIQDNSVEQIFHDDVEGVNFIDNYILFYKDNSLYKMNSEGRERIKKLKGKTAGFNGIRVEDNKMYMESYAGAFYCKISQIDLKGKVVKNIVK